MYDEQMKLNQGIQNKTDVVQGVEHMGHAQANKLNKRFDKTIRMEDLQVINEVVSYYADPNKYLDEVFDKEFDKQSSALVCQS
mmetsp:Transcript_12083/g.18672  ORF Transcript_12083/g.18672 Transcript_12083/m.18672 type:complete len:83 (-) Transcript_12083:1615-1863(-)